MKIEKMNYVLKMALLLLVVVGACKNASSENNATEATNENEESATSMVFPDSIKIENIAQNPEGIEYNHKDQTFFLSSLNASPIIKINIDGTYKPFTSGEAYPMSTAGLQIDQARGRLLATGFNAMELYDNDPATKGVSNLRIYNLETGVIEQDINLSGLIPDAYAYFANDIAVDTDGNTYVSDWFARVIYKVDTAGNASLFWTNETGVESGPNGLDFHPDGYLLVSILNVNDKGLYADFGLIKIPVNDPESAGLVEMVDAPYTGFDGMVLTEAGTIIGVTNNGYTPGGNTLLELSSSDEWKSASAVNTKAIKPSTTVAVTPEMKYFIINQDFQSNTSETWMIEQIKF